MTLIPSMPGPAPSGRSVQSRCLFSFRAADGTTVPRTGQSLLFSRTGTLTGTDTNGTTVTWRQNQPAWSMNGGVLRLRVQGGDAYRWSFPWGAAPGAVTLYARVRHAGWGYTATPNGYIGLTNDGSLGTPYLLLRSQGTNNGSLGATHHNGTSSVSVDLSSAHTDGVEAEYLLTMTAAGSIQLTREVAGVTVTTVASANLTPAAFAGPNLCIIGAYCEVRNLKVLSGAWSLTEVREAL